MNASCLISQHLRAQIGRLAVIGSVLATMAVPAWGADGLVAMDIRRAGTSITCSGVLISPTAVLTAAHCLDRATAVDVQPARSDGNLDAPIFAADWVVHPTWRIGSRHSPLTTDLAVVILRSPSRMPSAVLSTEGSATSGTVLRTHGLSPRPQARITSGRAVVMGPHGGRGTFRAVAEQDFKWCRGDSGSPTFVEANGSRRLVGLVVIGTALEASAALTTDADGRFCAPVGTLVDPAAHRAWIDAVTKGRQQAAR